MEEGYMYIVIVFRSRTDTLVFSQLLKSYGVRNSVVNTPRQVSVSCGVSVKIDANSLETAQNLLKRRQFNSYAGTFVIYQSNDGFSVKKI